MKNGSGRGIQAIIVYPMNALANSQRGELDKYVNFGFPDKKGPVTFARYTGQESDKEKESNHEQSARYTADELCHAGVNSYQT